MGGLEGFTGYVVTVEMMIAEATEGKMMIDSEMPQLQPRSFADISGQQSDGDIALAQSGKKSGDARQDLAFVRSEKTGQALEVPGEKLLQMVGRILNTVQPEQVADDGAIGPAAVRHAGVNRHTEFFGEGSFDGGPAGAAARQERAVDIKEQNMHEAIITSGRPLHERGRRQPLASKDVAS